MVTINLKKYYPEHYREDTYIDVDEKVADFMEQERPKPASAARKQYRYKAQYSLDAGDGIEEETLIRLFHEAERDERLRALLEQAMQSSLTVAQYRRVRMRFSERKIYRVIAAEENVSISTIEASIDGAVKKLRKYFCKHSLLIALMLRPHINLQENRLQQESDTALNQSDCMCDGDRQGSRPFR